ncbi:hypothetical protein LINPERPRIM_LOCUS9754 [Linum perenne]
MEKERPPSHKEEDTPSHGGTQKTERSRTFPVPLSETDGSDVSEHVVQVPTERDEDIARMPHSDNQVSEASCGATSDEAKEGIHGDRQSSEKGNCLSFVALFILLLICLCSCCKTVCALLFLAMQLFQQLQTCKMLV